MENVLFLHGDFWIPRACAIHICFNDPTVCASAVAMSQITAGRSIPTVEGKMDETAYDSNQVDKDHDVARRASFAHVSVKGVDEAAPTTERMWREFGQHHYVHKWPDTGVCAQHGELGISETHQAIIREQPSGRGG